MIQQFQATPKPYKVLSPLEALMESARLNRRAVELEAEGSQCMASWTATVANSLSTYALAMYAKEGWPS